MTTIYKPGVVPDDPRALPQFLRREFAAIKRGSEAGEPVTRRQVLHAAPAKAFEGDEVEADGTDWNPGSGRGKYVRRNGQWVFVGFISADWSTQVTGTGKPADNADVTTSVMGSSGTSILISSATLFKTTTGLGGVFIGSGGLVGKDSGGNTTFSINGTTGAATFAGSLSAATGTFAGSLSAATGTFAGALSAATGTFGGDITGTANINIAGTANFAGATSSGGKTYAVVAGAGTGVHGGLKGVGGSSAAGLYGTSASGGVPGVVAENTAGGPALDVQGAMQINNSTLVFSLNADLLDGNHASAFATAGHNHSGVYLPVAGNAASATQISNSGHTYTFSGGSVTGTATATFSSANKPGANSSNIWLAFVIDGTTYYAPAWPA